MRAPLAVSDSSALTDTESPEVSPSITKKMRKSTSKDNSNTDEIEIVHINSLNSETDDSKDFGNVKQRPKTIEKNPRDPSNRKSMRYFVRRRLSSFHEQIPVKIQNFVLKYILFAFNFLSWLGGLGAVGVGTWRLTDDEKVITDAVDFVLDPFIILCIIGAITFIIAFLGCVGAIREHSLMLKSFYICLSIVLVIELACAILVIVCYTEPAARDFLRLTPETLLKRAIVQYMEDRSIRNLMDTIQRQFNCCGISTTDEGYKDWRLNMYYNCTEENQSIFRCAVPESCCIYYPGERMNAMCGFGKTDKKLKEVQTWIYTRGCAKGFGEWLAEHEHMILLTVCVVMFMQLLGVVFARIFTKRVERRIQWQNLQCETSES
ncbi:tetraspanin-33-like isoform X2 [Ostrea edulis]|uniref:tetraspanin-33-like isoform X2 n=1 Tax=Ostrea edulis TaxID=37623 RepID=UPI0024AED6CB|nr:tetraspanin-33-like isoform X2 [Ostrea edulis]